MQNGLTEQPTLSIEHVTFLPNVKGAYGRFYFKPKVNLPTKLYKQQSKLSYNFGSYELGNDAICQIKNAVEVNSTYSVPGVEYSNSVAFCKISGTEV